MKRAPLLASLLLTPFLVAGCGGEKKSDSGGGGAEPVAVAKPDPIDEARKATEALQQREDRIAELRAKKADLDAKVARLDGVYKQMAAAHAEEEAGLPNPADLRPRLSRLIKDANSEKAKLAQMEKRFAEVKAVAEGSITGDLKALREAEKAIEARLLEAQSGWRQILMDERTGKVDVSPIQRQLTTVRAIKEKWFEVTPEARRGAAGSSVAKSINDGFRSWLSEAETRKTVATLVLEQAEAPKGKTPDTFDFTNLDFYVLLEIMENSLDRQNITVESKRLKEEEVKLLAIEAELAKASEKVAAKMSEGGGDLAEYEDLGSRLPAQRSKTNDLTQSVASMRENFSSIEEVKQAHLAAQDIALKELEAAKQELGAAATELRSAGG